MALALAGTACADAGTVPDAEKIRRIREMYEGYKAAFPEVPDVSVEEFLALPGDAVVLVDVRESEERAVSTIPGAVSRETFEADPGAWKGRRVVTYCTVGYRSGRYAAELRRRGIEAYNLAGSLLAWTHAGQKLVNADGETRRLHVYGKTWDLAAEGYETVW